MPEQVIDTLVTELLFRTDKSQLRGLQGNIEKIERGLGAASQAFTVIGAAASAAFGLAAKAAIDWETSFTGVRKTVDATDEQFAHLEGRLRRMARDEVPIDVNELAAIAESAGQLGIEVENIEGFTEVMAKLGVTTNLSSNEAATAFARLANITGMSQTDFDRLGSVVVDLGNNMATTEAEIVQLALRLAGAGSLINLTEPQILAIAASLSSVGVEAEMGGSAFSRVFADMQAAVQTQSKELGVFAKVAGTSATGFADVFNQDATRALVVFIQGLRRMRDEGGNVHEVLEGLGFANVRIRDALLRSAGAEEQLVEALALADNAWEENIALTKEAELRFGTTASKLQFLENRAYDARIAIGDQLTPDIENLSEVLGQIATGIGRWAEANPGLTRGLAGLSVATLALGIAMGAASFALAGLRHVIGAWEWLAGTEAFAKLRAGSSGAFETLKRVGTAALRALTRPIGLLGRAVAALGSIFSVKGALIVAALVAVVAAGRAAWTFLIGMFDGLLSKADPVLAALGRLAEALGLGPAVEALGAAVGYIDELFGNLFTTLGNWVKQAWDWLDFSEAGTAFGEAIGNGVIAAIDSLTGFVNWLKDFSLIDLMSEWIGLGAGGVGDLATAGATAGIAPGAINIAPVGGGATTNVGGARNTSITVDKIEVIANDGDPATIADGIGNKLTEVFHNTVEDFDSDVDR